MASDPDFADKIIVASGIVDHLSSGLYETPAACLKELINNSYDADARRVRVSIKPDVSEIVIADNGTGMDQEGFESNFQVISESHKREKGDKTKIGRPKIGFIGIGFIAANEICNKMVVDSTRKGDDTRIRAVIDFEKMRSKSLAERREADDDVKFEKGDYRGWIEPVEKSEQFTIVTLKGVHGRAFEMFEGATPEATAGGVSLYGKSAEMIAEMIASLRTWDDLDSYSKTMVEVALNVPVRYPPSWAPSRFNRQLSRFQTDAEELDFDVAFDGVDLRKPIVLGRSNDRMIAKTFKIETGLVSAHGYLFAQHGRLEPQELNGVLIRLRNAAIGTFDREFMGYRTSLNQMMRRWISSEVWIDRGLEDAMNIDRKTLRVTEPAYVELQTAFHKELESFFKEVRSRIYEVGNQDRRAASAGDVVTQISNVLEKRNVQLSAPDRRELTASIPENDSARVKRMLRKYSVAEIYDLVLEVADDELPENYFNKFAEALARRLMS